MATRQWALHNHVIGEALQTGILAQKYLQRPDRGHNDAQFDVAKTGVISNQRERAQVQARTQGDAVNARIQGRSHAHLQRVAWGVHGQLFHAVHKHQPIALFGLHGGRDVPLCGLRQYPKVKLDDGFIAVVDVVFVKTRLVFDEAGVETAV